MRAAFALLAALLVLPFAAHAGAPASASVSAYTAPNGGEGFVGTPAGTPLGLVVILHGYGHPAADHQAHLLHIAQQGYLAVAMTYTGDVNGFPLRAGADDTNSAIRDLEQQLPAGAPRYLYSVSMGTSVAPMVLSAHSFDYWVDNEGLSMLGETWTEASILAPANAFAKTASDAITVECGGSPAQNPACYQERSMALRVGDIQPGLKGVVLTHGLNDGLVPHNQGREMEAALIAGGIPTDFYTYLRCGAGNEGTTLTGYALGPAGAADPGAGLAGHGTESIDAHCLTELSFRLLDGVLAGHVPMGHTEHLVDNGETLA